MHQHDERAQDLLTQRLSEVGKGEWIEPDRHAATVEGLFVAMENKYRADHKLKESAKTPSTRRWRHLKKSFAHLPAAKLTTDGLTRYVLLRQKEGAKNATINRELASLRRAFNLARRSTPPKVRVVPYFPMLKEQNTRTGFVEEKDYAQLTAGATELWLRTLLELAYTYGWRRGELLSLRVRQNNFEQRTIRLDPGTTKNDEGREVAMTPKVYALLRSACEGKGPNDFVLTREKGSPVRDFRDAWYELCVKVGLGKFFCANCAQPVVLVQKRYECAQCNKKLTKDELRYEGRILHDMRRSAAKSLRAAGVPESVIMATGGWKTAAMFRRYAIVSSADQRAAMDALERWRAQNGPEQPPKPPEAACESVSVVSEKLQ